MGTTTVSVIYPSIPYQAPVTQGTVEVFQRTSLSVGRRASRLASSFRSSSSFSSFSLSFCSRSLSSSASERSGPLQKFPHQAQQDASKSSSSPKAMPWLHDPHASPHVPHLPHPPSALPHRERSSPRVPCQASSRKGAGRSCTWRDPGTRSDGPEHCLTLQVPRGFLFEHLLRDAVDH